MNAQSLLKQQQYNLYRTDPQDPVPGILRTQTSFGSNSRPLQRFEIDHDQLYQPKILAGFNQIEDNSYGTQQSTWLMAKKQSFSGTADANSNIDPHQMFYRSVSSNMGTNQMRYSNTNYNDSMARTFAGGVAGGPVRALAVQVSKSPLIENGNLPPQPRMLKIKQLKPIRHSQSMNTNNDNNVSLGETLRQNRVLREHIERERAEMNQSRVNQQEVQLRIRPATPRLNLLKMKKQLPIQSQIISGSTADTWTKPDQKQIRKRKKPHRLVQLQPLSKLPDLPQIDVQIPDKPAAKQKQIKLKNGQKTQSEIETDYIMSPPLITEVSKNDQQSRALSNEVEQNSSFERDPQEANFDFYDNQRDEISAGNEEEEIEYYDEEMPGGGLISNFHEKFEEIIENHEVSDAIDLNEKFLAEHLGVKPEELSLLKKIELRVDTSCHNLQVTGEILCSLESLRMSDSIIKCFRDIGTSFRFVRILHLARCELKEVQGIQAFLNLEELYISYNQIDDLFDIGFLEYLQILDLEGNNVKNLEDINPLRRCKNLIDVNLKNNPISLDEGYQQKMIETVPSLEILDDREIMNFLQEIPIHQEVNIENIISQSGLIQRLLKLCQIQPNQYVKVQNICSEGLGIIKTDDSDMAIMANIIKSYPTEKKAQRQFFDNIMLDCETNEIFRKTFSSSLRGQTPKKGISRPGSGAFRQTAGTSFYNASTRKSTANMKENDQYKANQSDEKRSQQGSTEQLHLNSDKQLTKAIIQQSSSKNKGVLTIQRSRITPAQHFSQNTSINRQLGLHNQSSERIPHDIFSLINDTEVNLKQGKDIIKSKLTQNSSSLSFYSGDEQSQSNQVQTSNKSASRIRALKNVMGDVLGADARDLSLSQPKGHRKQDRYQITQDPNGPQAPLGTAIRVNNGTDDAVKRPLVLRAKDIQFTASFKKGKVQESEKNDK